MSVLQNNLEHEKECTKERKNKRKLISIFKKTNGSTIKAIGKEYDKMKGGREKDDIFDGKVTLKSSKKFNLRVFQVKVEKVGKILQFSFQTSLVVMSK